MNKIIFSELSYYPSAVTNENMVVGMLFYNCDTSERTFKIMKNWSRLQNFDDELDIEFMKSYLKGIKYEYESNLSNYEDVIDVKEFIKFYVNELRFADIKNAFPQDAAGFIEETTKVYMRRDFAPEERLNSDAEVRYIKSFMRDHDIKYRTSAVSGGFDETVHYDYVIGDYGFKCFTFENKKISRLITTAKAWFCTALKSKQKTIFIYDKDINESKDFKVVMDILSEHAESVLNTEEAINFILKLKSDSRDQQIEINLKN